MAGDRPNLCWEDAYAELRAMPDDEFKRQWVVVALEAASLHGLAGLAGALTAVRERVEYGEGYCLTTQQLADAIGIGSKGVWERARAHGFEPRIVGGVALWPDNSITTLGSPKHRIGGRKPDTGCPYCQEYRRRNREWYATGEWPKGRFPKPSVRCQRCRKRLDGAAARRAAKADPGRDKVAVVA